jgi:hypothetical protein
MTVAFFLFALQGERKTGPTLVRVDELRREWNGTIFEGFTLLAPRQKPRRCLYLPRLSLPRAQLLFLPRRSLTVLAKLSRRMTVFVNLPSSLPLLPYQQPPRRLIVELMMVASSLFVLRRKSQTELLLVLVAELRQE